MRAGGTIADIGDRRQAQPEPSGRARASPAAQVVLAVLVGVFILHARAWEFLCDDAFISFRYADNLAEHGSLAFNVHIDPPERVEGYTNFLWVLVLAGAAMVGISPPTTASLLTVVGAAAALAAVTWLCRVARCRLSGEAPTELRSIDLVPAMILVAQPEFMVWAHSGLETSTAAALVIAAMAAWTSGRLRSAAVLAAAAVLARPDAALPIATFGATWLLVQAPAVARDRALVARVPWRRVAVATLLFAAPVVGHLLWRHAYYGSWVPNTWSIKQFGRLLAESNGVPYVIAWLSSVRPWVLLAFVPMLRPRHAVLVVPAAATVTYGWWIGGDFMAYSRFYVVPTILVAALAGWLAADTAAWLARRKPSWSEHARVLVVALGVVWALACVRAAYDRHTADVAEQGWLDGRWEGVATMDRFAKVGLGAGEWMREHLPPQTLISVGAAGAVPYASGLQVIDAFGLVDPSIARLPGIKPDTREKARPGHQLWAPVEYIKQRDPDLVCHVGYRGAKHPTTRDVHRAFARGYVWACIKPGDGKRDSYYCCRRPQDRIVGPFGVPGGAR